MRKFQASVFSVIERDNYAIYPPQKIIALSKQVKKSLIASAVLFALISANAQAQDFIYTPDTPNYKPEINKILTIDDKSDTNSYDNIDILLNPPVEWDRYTVSVSNSQSLTVSGDTTINLEAIRYVGGDNSGTNALYAVGSDSSIDLKGNVTINIYHNVPEENKNETVGANNVYASDGATINLGNTGTKTQIWSIALKPDAISAKWPGSTVNILSTHNQIIGNFEAQILGTITGVWSGSDSYWYGDDESILGVLDLTFEDRAQWTYFENKTIQSITLRNNGIINLHDKKIEESWINIGLLDVYKDLAQVKHDYVVINSLKGNGGIFLLDLNADNKSQSDMIFINRATDKSLQFIEPYDIEKLESVNENNTVIFAVADKNATGVNFADKVNLEGERLFDYELEIASSTLTKEDLNREEFTSKDQSASSYVDGTKWFIQRILMSKSSAAKAMTGAGFASYDAANEMDRRDRRLLQTYKNEAGMWVRARHGERGVDNEYNYQLNGASIGIDHQLNNINTLGLAFSYEEGDTDFESVRGKGDMKRYEFAIYNTYDYGAPYLDLVGRLGLISSNYDSYNQKGTLKTSGDFDQKYASLSAEVGYTLMDNNGVFIEPQLQFQVAYLDGYDYSSDRSMKVDVDREVAVLSRIGLRAGKHFDTTNITGEVYSRADVYHQFTDGQDAIFSDPTHEMQETWGTNKTYASIGLGSYLKVNDNWGLQFDIEKNIGGKTLDTWLITGQAKYQF